MAIIATKKTTKTGSDTTATNKQKGKKVCSCCKTEKNLTEFYISYSPMCSIDQRTAACKECCKTSALNEDGTINYPKLKNLLRQIDRPLYYELLDSSESSIKKENSFLSDEETNLHGYDILSKYFTLISMRQTRAKSYAQSEEEGFIFTNNNRTVEERDAIVQKYAPLFETISTVNNSSSATQNVKPRPVEDVVYNTDKEFQVTQQMIDLFGDGYTPSLYKKMFDKYEKLKINYSLQTNIHQEALATYVRFKIQEELATSKGDVAEASKWYSAAQSAAQDAKLTPKQLTKADLDSGINSISELTKALEQAVDVIKILPRFKYRPNDAPDFNIWCYVNYERKLNDQPDATYEDVYQFYDKRKREYIEQNGDPYGIFINDTTEKNRDTVKTFIKLPDDYEDLAGDDDESN